MTNTAVANTTNTNTTATLKEKRLKKFTDYRDEKALIECYQKAIKGVESGSNGKYFETIVKIYLNNIKGKCVSTKNRIDTTKNKKSFEIKVGGGTIGKVKNDLLVKENNSQYIIYCPIYGTELPALENSFVFNFDDFFNEIIRNNMYTVKKNGLIKIQNYKHRQKSTKKMQDFLKNYGIPFFDFKF